MSRIASILLFAPAFALLISCSDAPPPNKDTEKHTELRDAIQRPLDKARAVDATVQKAKEQQDRDIEKQVNGQAPDAKSDDDKAGGH